MNFLLKTGKRWYFITAILIVLFPGEHRCAFADGDVEFWQTTMAFIDVHQDWTVSVQEHLKVGDDAGKFYYQHTDLGFLYKGFAKGVNLGFSYKQIFKKDDDGHWEPENRPHFNLLLKGRLGSLDVLDRSRMEFRDRQDDEDLWRYSHRLKITLPIELTALKFRPYIADQVYLNLEGKTFDKNRIYSGVILELPKKIESEFYYMWQSSKPDGQWEDLNALGLLFRIRF